MDRMIKIPITIIMIWEVLFPRGLVGGFCFFFFFFCAILTFTPSNKFTLCELFYNNLQTTTCIILDPPFFARQMWINSCSFILVTSGSFSASRAVLPAGQRSMSTQVLGNCLKTTIPCTRSRTVFTAFHTQARYVFTSAASDLFIFGA